MFTINVTFEDEEAKMLKRLKGKSESWHDFILALLKSKKANTDE